MINKTPRPYAKRQPLLVAADALTVLRSAMRLFALSNDTAATVVILAIAAMGLNLCVGYAGLVSFGHSTWFGIGGHAAAPLQRTRFPRDVALAMLFLCLF